MRSSAVTMGFGCAHFHFASSKYRTASKQTHDVAIGSKYTDSSQQYRSIEYLYRYCRRFSEHSQKCGKQAHLAKNNAFVDIKLPLGVPLSSPKTLRLDYVWHLTFLGEIFMLENQVISDTVANTRFSAHSTKLPSRSRTGHTKQYR